MSSDNRQHKEKRKKNKYLHGFQPLETAIGNQKHEFDAEVTMFLLDW